MKRPAEVNAFEFAVLASLRAAQLMRGCTPRVEGSHKVIVTAQMEVAERKVARDLNPNDTAAQPPADPASRPPAA